MGDRYAFVTPRGKRGIVDKLSQVPASAKTKKSTSATKKKPKKSSPKKTPKRRRTDTAKKKKRRSSGLRLPGGIGPKAVIGGIIGLRIAPMFLPQMSPGMTKLAAGLGLRALKIGGGGPLAAVGIMETVAELAAPYMGGIPIIGGGGNSNAGGYDY